MFEKTLFLKFLTFREKRVIVKLTLAQIDMQKVLIATHNQGKFKEIMEVLEDLPFEFVSLNDLNVNDDVEENEDSYAKNAQLKADFFHELTKLPTIADDSGIEVSVLKNELGVKTRRWGAGEKADDKEWLEFFLDRMHAEKDRSACFKCFIAVAGFNKEAEPFEGECLGNILHRPASHIEPGIPLSSVFLPLGAKKVFSALTKTKKNAISHRGKAVHKLKNYLQSMTN